MQCANIIIVTQDGLNDDEEAAQVRDLLKLRYRDRSVTVFEFKKGNNNIVNVSGTGTPKEDEADTGIYVIVHGTALTGFWSPLNTQEAAEAFATTLLSWVTVKFRIKKLCLIVCSGVAKDGAGNVLPVPPPAPGKLPTVTKIFVQQICQAISKIDTNRTLNGLMVAGYSEGVYVTKDPKKADHPVKTTQYEPPPLDDFPEFNLKHRMRPMLDAKKLPTKLTTYASHKRVFVWDNGQWKLGKLSDYTDSQKYREKLQHYGL
jgi:hypothetical protein